MSIRNESRPFLAGMTFATALAMLGAVLAGQGIVIPNTFSNQTVADADQVNQNFAAVSNNALNRSGGTMTGTLNTLNVLPVTDLAYSLGDATHRYMNTVPTGAVIFYNGGTACPGGFNELTTARGRYIVGLRGGGTLSATVGTALTDQENRATGSHTHTFQLYQNGGNGTFPVGGSSSTLNGTSPATDALSGGVAGTNAPYIQLLVCVKT